MTKLEPVDLPFEIRAYDIIPSNRATRFSQKITHTQLAFSHLFQSQLKAKYVYILLQPLSGSPNKSLFINAALPTITTSGLN